MKLAIVALSLFVALTLAAFIHQELKPGGLLAPDVATSRDVLSPQAPPSQSVSPAPETEMRDSWNPYAVALCREHLGVPDVEGCRDTLEEFDRLFGMACRLYARNTERQVADAARNVCYGTAEYRPSMTLREALELLIDEAPPELAVTKIGMGAAREETRVGGASASHGAAAIGVEHTRLGVEGISVRQAADAIVKRLYEEHMAPIWAEQQAQEEAARQAWLAEQQRIQANMAHGMAIADQSRQERAARRQALNERAAQSQEFLLRKGTVDQVQREQSWNYRR